MTFRLLWKEIDSFLVTSAMGMASIEVPSQHERERERESKPQASMRERERTKLVMYEITFAMKNFLYLSHMAFFATLKSHSSMCFVPLLFPFYVSRALENREYLVTTCPLNLELNLFVSMCVDDFTIVTRS